MANSWLCHTPNITALHCTSLNFTALHCTSLHFMTVSPCEDVWQGDTLAPKFNTIWLKPLFQATSHQDRLQFLHLKGVGCYTGIPQTSSFCEDFLS